MVGREQGRVMVTRAYEVDASSMCDVLGDVSGVQGVSLEFDSRGNGVLRIRLRPDVDEDAVVGAAVAQLHRQFGVGLEGGRMRLTGPSGRTVVAVVEPVHRERATWTSWSDGPDVSGLDSVSEPDAWVPYLRSWDRPVRPVPDELVPEPSQRDREPEAVAQTEAETQTEAVAEPEAVAGPEAVAESQVVSEPVPALPVEEPWAPRVILNEPLLRGPATPAPDLPTAPESAPEAAPEAGTAVPSSEIPPPEPEDLVPDVTSLSPEVYELALKVAELALDAGGSEPVAATEQVDPEHELDLDVFARELDEPEPDAVVTVWDLGEPVHDEVAPTVEAGALEVGALEVDETEPVPADVVVEAGDGLEPEDVSQDLLDAPEPAAETDAQPVPQPLVEGPVTPTSTDSGRLVLDRVEVATGRMELWATVHLRAGEALYTGTASATATGSGANRAGVGATARAAESAMGGCVRLDVEAVDMLGIGSDRVGVVVVTLLSERGVDRVTGAALVRGDARETLVRATLDALNRRTERSHATHI
jgi:hypothetical protein